MKKTYQIEVDCANCANLMEEAAKKTEGVANATVNFMTQKMIVEFAEGADEKKTMKSASRTSARSLCSRPARRSSRTARSNFNPWPLLRQRRTECLL